MHKIRVIKITKSGFGSKPGQLPTEMREPLMIFDYVNNVAAHKGRVYLKKQLTLSEAKGTNASFRCPREGFVPFNILGELIEWARRDGVPMPGTDVVLDKNGMLKKAPLYLVVSMVDNFISALAFLYAQPDDSLKLEYLCAAPRFKGAGSALLELLRSGQVLKRDHKGLRALYLDNNSGLPGYYLKRGFRRVGKETYKQKDPKGRKDKRGNILMVNKVLNTYKASIKPSISMKKKITPKKTTALPARSIQTRAKTLQPRYRLRKRTIY